MRTLTPELESNILASLSTQPLVDGVLLKQIADSLGWSLRETAMQILRLYAEKKYVVPGNPKVTYETLFSRIASVSSRDPRPRFVLPGDLYKEKSVEQKGDLVCFEHVQSSRKLYAYVREAIVANAGDSAKNRQYIFDQLDAPYGAPASEVNSTRSDAVNASPAELNARYSAGGMVALRLVLPYSKSSDTVNAAFSFVALSGEGTYPPSYEDAYAQIIWSMTLPGANENVKSTVSSLELNAPYKIPDAPNVLDAELAFFEQTRDYLKTSALVELDTHTLYTDFVPSVSADGENMGDLTFEKNLYFPFPMPLFNPSAFPLLSSLLPDCEEKDLYQLVLGHASFDIEGDGHIAFYPDGGEKKGAFREAQGILKLLEIAFAEEVGDPNAYFALMPDGRARDYLIAKHFVQDKALVADDFFLNGIIVPDALGEKPEDRPIFPMQEAYWLLGAFFCAGDAPTFAGGMDALTKIFNYFYLYYGRKDLVGFVDMKEEDFGEDGIDKVCHYALRYLRLAPESNASAIREFAHGELNQLSRNNAETNKFALAAAQLFDILPRTMLHEMIDYNSASSYLEKPLLYEDYPSFHSMLARPQVNTVYASGFHTFVPLGTKQNPVDESSLPPDEGDVEEPIEEKKEKPMPEENEKTVTVRLEGLEPGEFYEKGKLVDSYSFDADEPHYVLTPVADLSWIKVGEAIICLKDGDNYTLVTDTKQIDSAMREYHRIERKRKSV